ncbi:hypothetical protein [Pontibacter mangrovi]|uniref:Uncharacterized protein n=1 Tax=Pontibacter mangrovi TaxID=2589816 RepID=A0A501W0I2_9BACT|nr:hypothetical protein [Pontibacter mangrovi]TPE42798.1 hypothetical protein FJM65_15820 [Pontibacter mangrovi]
MANYPETLIRPFEFEGRNEYRREREMVPTDNLTTILLKSLYTENALTPQQREILQRYDDPTHELKMIASGSPADFNNAVTGSIAGLRQFYQHKKLTEITNAREEFANTYFSMPDGKK